MDSFCKVEWCGEQYYAKDYCRRHYMQFRKGGVILSRTNYDPNEIIIKGTVAEIILYNRKSEEIERAKIDTEDIGKVEKHKWYKTGHGRVGTKVNGIIVNLQHVILGVKSSRTRYIDHIDRNPLNNCKSNLRFCTHKENSRNRGICKSNTSGYKGVCWHKGNKKWGAQIRTNGKIIFLGYFKNAVSAAKAYNMAAINCFGKFAGLNEI